MTTPTDDLVRKFIADHFDDDAGLAIQRIATLYGIGVCYQGRADFEHELSNNETPLTDEEWEQISFHNDRLDEFLSVGDLLSDYREGVLRRAGFTYHAETGRWVAPPSACANCGEAVEPDDGGAIWYHADTSARFCDGDDERARSWAECADVAEPLDAPDFASSVSRQHYIDTGRYLTHREVREGAENQA